MAQQNPLLPIRKSRQDRKLILMTTHMATHCHRLLSLPCKDHPSRLCTNRPTSTAF